VDIPSSWELGDAGLRLRLRLRFAFLRPRPRRGNAVKRQVPGECKKKNCTKGTSGRFIPDTRSICIANKGAHMPLVSANKHIWLIFGWSVDWLLVWLKKS
jgi:hypothetical protein